jgi:hypothetical protein
MHNLFETDPKKNVKVVEVTGVEVNNTDDNDEEDYSNLDGDSVETKQSFANLKVVGERIKTLPSKILPCILILAQKAIVGSNYVADESFLEQSIPVPRCIIIGLTLIGVTIINAGYPIDTIPAVIDSTKVNEDKIIYEACLLNNVSLSQNAGACNPNSTFIVEGGNHRNLLDFLNINMIPLYFMGKSNEKNFEVGQTVLISVTQREENTIHSYNPRGVNDFSLRTEPIKAKLLRVSPIQHINNNQLPKPSPSPK